MTVAATGCATCGKPTGLLDGKPVCGWDRTHDA